MAVSDGSMAAAGGLLAGFQRLETLVIVSAAAGGSRRAAFSSGTCPEAKMVVNDRSMAASCGVLASYQRLGTLLGVGRLYSGRFQASLPNHSLNTWSFSILCVIPNVFPLRTFHSRLGADIGRVWLHALLPGIGVLLFSGHRNLSGGPLCGAMAHLVSDVPAPHGACLWNFTDVQALHSRRQIDMTLLCPPSGVSRLGILPLTSTQCFLLASDDGMTTVVACKLSLKKKKKKKKHAVTRRQDVQHEAKEGPIQNLQK